MRTVHLISRSTMCKIFSFPLLNLLHLLTVSINIASLKAYADHIAPDENVKPGDSLYLTPLILRGQISEAVEAAYVHNISPIVSYSGLITANSTFNSNIFFWFFPAAEKQEADNYAPVIFWNNGARGLSCMIAIFSQNGPFTGNYDGETFEDNPFSWHKRFNMIYADIPVETGFSFTDNEGGYVNFASEAAKDSYEFLTQFFQLFPYLQKNPIYVGGESYGSTYALQIANYIHHKNQEGLKTFTNLKGLILGSAWIDPYTQVEYADYFFHIGLISECSRDYFREQQTQIRNLIDKNFYLEAFLKFSEMLNTVTMNTTGYAAFFSVYDDEYGFNDMTKFITRNSTRKAIHVGSLKYYLMNPAQQERMQPNVMRSSKPELEILLQAGYKILIYVGNMDGIACHIGIQQLIKSLSWEGAPELLSSTRKIWRENENVAGYNMTSTNMTFLIVRNAGHMCLLDQPEWVLDAVNSFIY